MSPASYVKDMLQTKVDDLPKPLLLTAKCSNLGELVTTFGIPNLIYSASPGEDEAGGGRRQR
jgi:hypothetical protein